jgi:NADH-quinone oxidoreductase subunit C
MTKILATQDVKNTIDREFPEAITGISGQAVILNSDSLSRVAGYLKKNPDLAFNYLNYITATDYYDYFELVYQVTSLEHNHSLQFKVRCPDRIKPSVPSVTDIWRGADFQEREIFDLFGINFEGHPNLKRIALWEGFQGHPLRKDYF